MSLKQLGVCASLIIFACARTVAGPTSPTPSTTNDENSIQSIGINGDIQPQTQPQDVVTLAPTVGPTDIDSWYTRVHKAQATQPKWITPLVTVTPRLEEEFRYDQYWENLGNGEEINNYGSGKGLELIPTESNELIINIPPYEERSYVKRAEGFGDDTVLLIKQRLASANPDNGNYIVTAFLSFLAPTGSEAFTSHAWEITPTIAGGKGYGRSDVQGTFGVSLPTSHQKSIGTPVATNIAVQYNVGKLWPEIEFNDTYFSGGERGGKNQLLLTPGTILGRFKLSDYSNFIFGVGYQFAVAPAITKEPALTPTYTDAWLTSARVTF